jgi:hypothetical protein
MKSESTDRSLKGILRLGLLPALVLITAIQPGGFLASRPPDKASPLRVRIHLAPQAAEGIAALGLEVPVTGRVFFIISTSDRREPREEIDATGVPFWGKDVSGFAAGDWVSLDDRDEQVLGYPLPQFSDLPAGTYYVQAFLNVYTRFDRADGHTVYMHQDAGDGQWFWDSPGNAHSIVQAMDIDPSRGGKIDLELTEVIPPIDPLEPGDVLQQGNPTDTEWVKYVKIQSAAVSEFWGQPMYIGANILLPAGYDDNPDTYYPVIYLQGHFPGSSAPFGFRTNSSFGRFWMGDDAPRFIAVVFRDATPYYDTSYSIDSANVGPYGTAIVEELIPYIEEHFRIIHEPWARLLAGGSTGGWEAMAMKVWYPDDFSGTWAWCPDSLDFHYFQIVDVYDEDNAYFLSDEWTQAERPSARQSDGNIQYTIKQENEWEQAMGLHDRSGGQWDIWEAVYSPVGDDGYPVPIWDPVTGAIDHTVAEYWRANYDVDYKMEQEWLTLGPKLVDQLHITVGTMDTYYLNEAVYLVKDFLDSTTDPYAGATFDFGFRKPHCWRGESPNNPGQQMSYQEFIQIAWDWYEAHHP